MRVFLKEEMFRSGGAWVARGGRGEVEGFMGQFEGSRALQEAATRIAQYEGNGLSFGSRRSNHTKRKQLEPLVG